MEWGIIMRTELKVYILIFIAIFAVNRYLHYENDVKLIGTNDCYNRKNLDGVIKELDDKVDSSSDYYLKIHTEEVYYLISEMSKNENIIYLRSIEDEKLYITKKETRSRNEKKIRNLEFYPPSNNITELKVLTKEGKEIYRYNKPEQYYVTKSDIPKKGKNGNGILIASLLLQYRCKIKTDK